MWEEAIILGKELAEQYENEMFDFEQLSASLVRNINFCLTVIPFITFQYMDYSYYWALWPVFLKRTKGTEPFVGLYNYSLKHNAL